MGQLRVVHYTLDDYDQLPDDGTRYEILRGALLMTPAPIPDHQRILMNLIYHLDPYIRQHACGELITAPVDVVLGPDTVFQPDLLFLRTERAAEIVRNRIWGAPDLIVEVLSRGTARVDRHDKFRAYAEAGVREYWIVDPPRRAIERHRLQGRKFGRARLFKNGETLISPTFPGLAITVAAVFPVRHP